MQNIIEGSAYMNEFRHIMVIEIKLRKGKQVFYISQISGNQVIHANHVITLFNKSVAEM